MPSRPLLLALLCAALAGPVAADPDGGADPQLLSARAQILAMQRARAAVIGVESVAVEDAPSVRTLGRSRRGSGVIIDADGLVLTIGYLILEADHVNLVLGDDRDVPARVVAYDPATGFGLLQPLVPLRREPAPIGRGASLAADDTVMIASGGPQGAVSVARLVASRPFSGTWEYHLDTALFTAPARTDHSGAALMNDHGEVVGIGSLMMSDVEPPGRPLVPGNMFVPTDLLQPILAELRERGSTASSHRAWLGLNCDERDGQVRVLRVNPDSPAEDAGVRPGDRIVRIDGQEVAALESLWKRLWSGGPAERTVVLDVRRDGTVQTLTLKSVDRMNTLRRAQGI